MNMPKLKPFTLAAAALFLMTMTALSAAPQQQAENEQAAAADTHQRATNTRPDSRYIHNLFKQIAVETAQLDRNAEELEGYQRSLAEWESHAVQLNLIREHVNEAGKLEQKLRAAREAGSAWQQDAIDRVYPLLKELADNLESTISFLNAHQDRLMSNAYRDLVRQNAEMSHNLHKTIEESLDYAKNKGELEALNREVGRQ